MRICVTRFNNQISISTLNAPVVRMHMYVRMFKYSCISIYIYIAKFVYLVYFVSFKRYNIEIEICASEIKLWGQKHRFKAITFENTHRVKHK